MKLTQLNISNYKSLKNIQFHPSEITVVIGANGAGKSNLASAFDFLADLYASGIDFAIAKKGGFENIAFRRQRRTKSGISFGVSVELDSKEARTAARRSFVLRELWTSQITSMTFEHHFTLRAAKQSISADYFLEHESVELNIAYRAIKGSPALSFSRIKIERTEGIILVESNDPTVKERVDEYLDLVGDPTDPNANSEMEDSFLKVFFPSLANTLSGISVYQFSPQISRSPGAPSPNPKLSGYGQNLPSLIDWLSRKHPNKWASVLSAMRSIVPTLQSIETQYLHTKTLGLTFQEEGFSRPWTAEDVSDGTIQSLAILTALADPRNDLLFVEEPENSVHPWIVRQLANQLKKLSREKQVFVTTHSPVILNLVSPEDVWVCFKLNGETSLRRLDEISPDLASDWHAGEGRLFELLDLGIVPEAIPSGIVQ